MNIKKYLFFTIVTVLCFTFLLVILSRPTLEKKYSGKVNITASFYPLYFFTSQIGGDRVEINSITPSGIEPHEYEPTPLDIVKIRSSKLFVLNGNGLDPWAEKIVNELQTKGIATATMSDSITSLDGGDPHFWLDPVLVQKQADVIADILGRIDPDNTEEYKKNNLIFKNKLAELDAEYTKGLSSCALREIVVSHEAFNYLAKRYDLTAFHISGLSPDEEPTPSRIAETADIARRKKIQYIFFETLVSPKLAETVANEIGVKTLVLNPIEGLTEDDMQSGKDYFSLMRQNLIHLQTALSCI